MKGRNVVIKTNSKTYDVPVEGVLRWNVYDPSCFIVFHLSPLANGSLEIYVAGDKDVEPKNVECGAHEIKPVCPTCGKEK